MKQLLTLSMEVEYEKIFKINFLFVRYHKSYINLSFW